MITLDPPSETNSESQTLVASHDPLDAELARISILDFTMLKAKLGKEHGWTAQFCDEAEDLYRKFLALNLRYPGRKICPTGPIDNFWHAHILDTRAYMADCETVFGEYLHHFPYFGMRGEADAAALNDAFAQSIELFILHFAIDPTCGDMEARSCSVQNCP